MTGFSIGTVITFDSTHRVGLIRSADQDYLVQGDQLLHVSQLTAGDRCEFIPARSTPERGARLEAAAVRVMAFDPLEDIDRA